MNCEEFRRTWLDQEPTEEDTLDPRSAAHRSGCAACQSWLKSTGALDRVLVGALVVAPPLDLAARLAELPAQAALPRATVPPRSAWEYLIETLLLIVVGLGAIGVGIDLYAPLLPTVVDRLSALAQALPLVFSSPVVGYLQGLAFTTIEAMATLLLLVMGLYRLGPISGQWAQTE